MGLFDIAQERLKMAVDNKIIVDEDEYGYIYEKTTKEEVRAEVDYLLNNLRYEMIQINSSARALEQIAEAYRKELDLPYREYMAAYIGLSENIKAASVDKSGEALPAEKKESRELKDKKRHRRLQMSKAYEELLKIN